MSFSLTTATGIPDVISQFHAYAVANAGFVDAGDIVLAGPRTMKRLSKGGIFWHFVPFATGNGIRSFMGYTAEITDAPGVSGDAQPQPTYMSAWSFASSYPSLYMYTDDSDVVFAAVELTTGIFNHIGFGSITKLESFTGGEFLTAGEGETTFGGGPVFFYSIDSQQQHAPYVGQYANVIANAGAGFMRISGTNTDYQDFAGLGVTFNTNRAGMNSVHGISDEVFRDAPNEATLRSPIFPMYACILDTVTGLYRISGYVPNIRLCPNKYLDPAEIILTDWQTFPLTQKNASGLLCAPCGNYGLAYKRA